VLAGMTVFAAASLGASHRLGRVSKGYEAKFTMLDLPNLEHFGYGFGENPAHALVLDSELQRTLPE